MKRALLILIFIALLAGCATTPVPMTKQIQSNLGRIEGILVIPQNNIDVRFEPTNPGATGLIGVFVAAAIDSSRREEFEHKAASMKRALYKYDFREIMQSTMTDELIKLGKIDIAWPLRVESAAAESLKRKAYEDSVESAVLFCQVGYRIESGSLIVTARAELYPKTDSLKRFRPKPDDNDPIAEGNLIYRHVLTQKTPGTSPSSLRKDMTEAAASIARQLAADLTQIK